MEIDFVHFYVEDLARSRQWFVETLGFGVAGQPVDQEVDDQTETVVLRLGAVTFVLSAPRKNSSPVASFLSCHPAGVADVAFRVLDLRVRLAQATAAGAKVLQPLQSRQTSGQSFGGCLRWAQIQGWGGLRHTLLERQGLTPPMPGLASFPVAPIAPDALGPDGLGEGESAPPFIGIDHLVLNVASGELQPALDWYQQVLGFTCDRRFEIATARSGLRSQVLRHPEGGAQLPINEPTDSNSQIQEFLDLNRGPGIQHLALRTDNLVARTAALRQRGLAFLETPAGYYQQLQQRRAQLSPDSPRVDWQAIREQKILVDWQSSPEQGMLLQIFTQPIFSQPTFFLEFIERQNQAKGFGEGNFLALFAAIEQEQLQRQRD